MEKRMSWNADQHSNKKVNVFKEVYHATKIHKHYISNVNLNLSH